jgi:hypothetical protein
VKRHVLVSAPLFGWCVGQRQKPVFLLSGPLDITQDERMGIPYTACFGKRNQFGADGSLVMLRPGR